MQFIEQKITKLPTAPSRKDPKSEFDPKADDFLSALVILSAQLGLWTDQVNLQSTDWNNRYYAADSELTLLRGEVNSARLGRSSLAASMQEMNERVQHIVEVQNAITMGQVAVSVGRLPSPNDDVYPPGYTWIYPGTDDFWVCVGVAPGAARWRRSDGQLTRRLVKPVVQMLGSAATFDDVVIDGHFDSQASEVEWDATGSPSVISGDLSGSDSPTITLRWAASGNYTVRARVRGDGNVLHHSFWSDVRTILVGPSIYCGSGAYCGDGSYAGTMIL
ncbi:hypothetical protein SAMN05660653_00190 [Desulfonatronum thiosulfatophilum]|uniref:Uncharacterized protein n=1 Tax=Desulfonatronum thiosulfatophilum TaxID=617002 RepID=A0A1G6A6Z0_9BACT|nr:hypothetical protein [Desulfonatronum thiosulfatophilum]SDB04076.1 hypothetical protein SAMN05660653_00190 [Desulfonatronum thiosulfatophilum]